MTGAFALPCIVAFSGGADSTALLLMAARQWPEQVGAIHVHHGLQAAADDFAAHCEAFCAALKVPLQIVRVDARSKPGQSPEDAARRARYQAISEAVLGQKWPFAGKNAAQDAINCVASSESYPSSADAHSAPSLPTVLLAQHADDQVETMLLALSRGAGVDGLAGMPAVFERHGLRWARPFLSAENFMGAAQIRDWLAQQGLQARHPGQNLPGIALGQGWVEDPTNMSLAYTRNRIRLQLLPMLREVFPQYRETFARSARNMARSSEAMALSMRALETSVGLPPQIKALQSLPRPQLAQYLRHWLKTEHQTMGSEAQLQELMDQVAVCTTAGHQIRIKFGSGTVLRQGAVLGFQA